MKRILIILCLLSSIIINAQVIDFNNFSEKIMNEVMFTKMNEYTNTKGGYSLILSTVSQQKIYRYLKKNSDKLSIESLSFKINSELLKEDKTRSSMSVGILDSISCDVIQTYQDISDKCIIDWKDNPSDAFFMIGYGKIGGVTTFYDKKNKTVYISFEYSN